MTLAFVVCVLSHGRHDVASLLVFFAYPVALATWAGLPAGWIARKVALVLPVALLAAVPNVWFDREVMVQLGAQQISGDWVSLLSIVLQLLFLCRYLVLMGEEAQTLLAALAQRAGGRALDLRLFATLAARLLLRTWEGAGRIHGAIRARGFQGALPSGRASRMGWREALFIIGWCLVFLLLRVQSPALALGAAVPRVLGGS